MARSARLPYPRPAVVAGLLALIVSCACWAGGLLRWPELISLDLRYRVRGAEQPGTSIVLVPISQRMFDLGIIYTWPISRDIYTHALANLRRAGARAVGIDVLLEATTPQDALLAAELRQWQGRAILAYRLSAGVGEIARGSTPVDVRAPAPSSARDYAQLPGNGVLAPDWPRGVGYTGVSPDADGVVHSLAPRQMLAGTALDSFPLALARLTDPSMAARYQPDREVTIDYAGPPGTFPVAADLDLVAGGLFDPRLVAGKIVLIGSTDRALKDLFIGPFDQGAAVTPGVELNANAIWTLLGDRSLRRVPAALTLGVLAGLSALTLLSSLRLRPVAAAASALLLVAGYALLCQVLFAQRVWLELAAPLLGAGLTYVAAQVARVVEALAELRRVEAIFGRYVSPTVVRQLLGREEALRLGGQRREISVLFSDIRGFTTLSEHLPPEQVGAMLNEYFTVMVDVVFAHGGSVDKFVGDAIMALFNAPLEQPDHAVRAAETALAMQAAAEGLQAGWEAQGRRGLRMGIGVHCGPAVVGSFGAQRRSDYTAIGDTVNVAARLEGLSKDLGCSVVISAAVAARLPALAPFEPLGPLTIRGRGAPLEAYGLRRPEPPNRSNKDQGAVVDRY